MAKTYMKTIIVIPVILSLAALCGCVREDEDGAAPAREQGAQVRISGGLTGPGGRIPLSKAETVPGPIDHDPTDPAGVSRYGLPDRQLDVAIVTVTHDPAGDPALPQHWPGIGAWSGQTAGLMRGFFGSRPESPYNDGILPTGIQPTDGRIEFVNSTGEYIQRTFYDDAGAYYYARVVYPYAHARFVNEGGETGATVVFSDLNGQQDILSSNLAWGNKDRPLMQALDYVPNPAYDPGLGPSDPGYGDEPETMADPNNPDSVITLSHMLSLFRFWIDVENENVRREITVSPATGADTLYSMYGAVDSIVVRFQPEALRLRMLDNSLSVYDPARQVDYVALMPDSDGDGRLNDVAVYIPDVPVGVPEFAGSVMVLPGMRFRIEAHTTGRMWIGADYEFGKDGIPTSTQRGKVYDITLRFREAYELNISASEPDDWWMDSEFN